MTCPKCGSQNLRVSRRSEWMDMFHRAALHNPIRCRDCRNRFYARPSGDLAVRADNSRHPKPLMGARTRRRLVEAVIFAAMLALFLVILHYLTREKVASPDALLYPGDSASLALNNPRRANIQPETATRGNG